MMKIFIMLISNHAIQSNRYNRSLQTTIKGDFWKKRKVKGIQRNYAPEKRSKLDKRFRRAIFRKYKSMGIDLLVSMGFFLLLILVIKYL